MGDLMIDMKKAMEAAYNKHAESALDPQQISREPDVNLKEGMNETQKRESSRILAEGMNAAFTECAHDAIGTMKKPPEKEGLSKKTQRKGLEVASEHRFVDALKKQREQQRTGPVKQPPHFK